MRVPDSCCAAPMSPEALKLRALGWSYLLDRALGNITKPPCETKITQLH